METPHTNHLTAFDFEHVYEPAQDTFLLLDALEDDLTYLQQQQPCVCLEIGTGSGLIITAVAKQLRHSVCLATDINPHACKVAKSTAKHNGAVVDVIHCNLVDSLRPQCVDLLIFNPPYVVTTDEELIQSQGANYAATQRNLVYSWAGGTDGRRIIDELLQKLDNILSPVGVFYLLLLRENKPDEVIERLHALNFKAQKFMERRIPGEYLFIIKCTR